MITSHLTQILKGGGSANKFRKLQMRKFADFFLLDLQPVCKCGNLRIWDLWTKNFCELRIIGLRTQLFLWT
jgi:hypothetical protein